MAYNVLRVTGSPICDFLRTGSIPKELSVLSKLIRLDLSDNQLTGKD